MSLNRTNNSNDLSRHKQKYHKYKTKYFIEKLADDMQKLQVPTKIQKEVRDWITIFKVLKSKYQNIKIYLKGGSVLGFEVLKLSGNLNLTKFLYNYQLGLIRDWDFVIHSRNPQPPEIKGKCKLGLYDEIINVMTNKERFRLEGANTCIVRHKYKNLIGNDEALFESAVIIKEHIISLSSIEIPLTAMYNELGSKSYFDFFKIVCIYRLLDTLDLTNNPFYESLLKANKVERPKIEENFLNHYKEYKLLDLIKIIADFVKNINITILPSINGYPKITSVDQLDYGVMKEYKKELFDTFDCDLSEKQFLLCQYNNSMRLVRLQWKNIPKSNKIKKYFKTINEPVPTWILDEQKTVKLLNLFDNHLYNTLFKRYYDVFQNKSNTSLTKIR